MINVFCFIITLKCNNSNSTSQQIIPVEKNLNTDKNDLFSYEFEPDEDEILEDLLPKIYQLKSLELFWKMQLANKVQE